MMGGVKGTDLEDLRVLRRAEVLGDRIWDSVVKMNGFQRATLGEQLVKASDSIGANIAESYGRYHYGEKIRFLYIARGSLYETKYWLRRAYARKMISANDHHELSVSLERIGRELNRFVSSLRRQRRQKTD